MHLAIALALLFLFIGLCVAAVAFEVKRHGWKPVIRYLIVAVIIRLLIHFAPQHIEEAEQIVIPLVGAGLVVWLWPRIVAQRMSEKEEDAAQNFPPDPPRSG